MNIINWIRNLDIRKVAYAIGIATLVEQGIVSGDAPLAGLLSDPHIATLVAVCKLLIWTNGFILIGQPATAVKWPSPPALIKACAALAVLIGALVFGAPVYAQTAAKAAPAAPDPCTQSSCTTWYVGGNLVNTGGNFDVIGSGLSGLASNGLMFGGDLGAQFWNGQWFAAIEADAEYELTLNAPNNTGLGTGNSYALAGQVKLGYSLAELFGASTAGATVPTLPSALQNALISPYIAVGVWDRPWGAGLATGAGVQGLIAQDWTIDAEYLHVNYANATINPNVSEQTENLFMVGLNRHFAF